MNYRDTAIAMTTALNEISTDSMLASPNFRVMVHMADRIKSYPYIRALWPELIGAMTIDVSQDAWDAAPDEILDSANALIDLLARVARLYKTEFGDGWEKMLLAQASEFKFTYS